MNTNIIMNNHYLFYVEQNYSFSILRPIQAEIKERGETVRWFLVGDEVDQSYLNDDEEQLYTLRDIYQYKPNAVFAPGNFVPSFIPGLKVAVFHGFNVGKRSDERGHFNIRGCFDLYCTQGPNTTEKFEQLAKLHKFFQVKETGWSMLDPLFSDRLESNSNRTMTILFCSTFSKNLTCAPHLLNEIKRLRDQNEWHWLVQFHPKMSVDTVNAYKQLQNDKLEFIETDNVIPLLKRADIMLCDTSSILLSFILQNKPVVTYKNQRPGPHLINVTNISDIENSLKNALTRPEALIKRINQFNHCLHPYSDGKSSQRVLDAVDDILSKRINMKRKPLNLVRNIKTLFSLIKRF